MVGEIEVVLAATITAPNLAWIAVLQDVDSQGETWPRCDGAGSSYVAILDANSGFDLPSLPLGSADN
jgi:hypothetical protein